MIVVPGYELQHDCEESDTRKSKPTSTTGTGRVSGLQQHSIIILGKIAVTIALNGWMTQEKVSLIARNHQSILGRDLLGTPVMELGQRRRVMGITWEDSSDSAEGLEELQ